MPIGWLPLEPVKVSTGFILLYIYVFPITPSVWEVKEEGEGSGAVKDETAQTVRSAADSILRDLQENPDMWLQVMHILQITQNLNTKFFALQVLEGVIKYRWNALPAEQRDGMKNFIFDIVVQVSTVFHKSSYLC
ncbi:hypothetical protein KIW84_074702 [Lathyrus oleraceus]|uniref:Importin N-terminal domain-containing protein n=1 Tax=Pisum sativum TaxID=3888 RepID=A0A9D4VTI3_PEA|nr:hypothetical protein KIW84_074702 [Pisum sativum]